MKAGRFLRRLPQG